MLKNPESIASHTVQQSQRVHQGRFQTLKLACAVRRDMRRRRIVHCRTTSASCLSSRILWCGGRGGRYTGRTPILRRWTWSCIAHCSGAGQHPSYWAQTCSLWGRPPLLWTTSTCCRACQSSFILGEKNQIKQMKNGWYVCVVSHVRRSLVLIVGQVSFGHQPPEPELRSIIKNK